MNGNSVLILVELISHLLSKLFRTKLKDWILLSLKNFNCSSELCSISEMWIKVPNTSARVPYLKIYLNSNWKLSIQKKEQHLPGFVCQHLMGWFTRHCVSMNIYWGSVSWQDVQMHCSMLFDKHCSLWNHLFFNFNKLMFK